MHPLHREGEAVHLALVRDVARRMVRIQRPPLRIRQDRILDPAADLPARVQPYHECDAAAGKAASLQGGEVEPAASAGAAAVTFLRGKG